MGARVRNLLLGVVVCGAFALIAITAIADQGGSVAPGDGVEQVTEVEPEAEEAVSLLEEQRSAADVVPAEVAEMVEEKVDFGTNADLARLAVGNVSHEVFVVPGRDRVCLAFTIEDGASFNCPSTDDIAAGKAGPTTIALAGGTTGVFGIVPDGVETVALYTDGPGVINVPIDDNVYYTAVPAGVMVQRLDYTGPGGPVQFNLTDPRAAFEEGPEQP